MSLILIGLLLAHSKILPEVDRRALEIAARAEVRNTSQAPVARPSAAGRVRHRHAAPVVPPPPVQPAPGAGLRRSPPANVRSAAGVADLDLSAITTICRAAGGQPDPAAFLSTLSRAYAMAPDRSAVLRTSCAAYLAGRADARGN